MYFSFTLLFLTLPSSAQKIPKMSPEGFDVFLRRTDGARKFLGKIEAEDLRSGRGRVVEKVFEMSDELESVSLSNFREKVEPAVITMRYLVKESSIQIPILNPRKENKKTPTPDVELQGLRSEGAEFTTRPKEAALEMWNVRAGDRNSEVMAAGAIADYFQLFDQGHEGDIIFFKLKFVLFGNYCPSEIFKDDICWDQIFLTYHEIFSIDSKKNLKDLKNVKDSASLHFEKKDFLSTSSDFPLSSPWGFWKAVGYVFEPVERCFSIRPPRSFHVLLNPLPSHHQLAVSRFQKFEDFQEVAELWVRNLHRFESVHGRYLAFFENFEKFDSEEKGETGLLDALSPPVIKFAKSFPSGFREDLLRNSRVEEEDGIAVKFAFWKSPWTVVFLDAYKRNGTRFDTEKGDGFYTPAKNAETLTIARILKKLCECIDSTLAHSHGSHTPPSELSKFHPLTAIIQPMDSYGDYAIVEAIRFSWNLVVHESMFRNPNLVYMYPSYRVGKWV